MLISRSQTQEHQHREVNKLNLSLKQPAKSLSAEYNLSVFHEAETTPFQIHSVHNSVSKQIKKCGSTSQLMRRCKDLLRSRSNGRFHQSKY